MAITLTLTSTTTTRFDDRAQLDDFLELVAGVARPNDLALDLAASQLQDQIDAGMLTPSDLDDCQLSLTHQTAALLVAE